MADFFDDLQKTIDEKYNVSITENGALGFATTFMPLLDLNYMVASLRSLEKEKVTKLFAKAYFENKLLAIKWLFFAGDVRFGLGERRLFRIGLEFLANTDLEYCKKLIPLVAEYTRFDNLLVLLDTDAKPFVIDYIKTQLEKDLEDCEKGKPVSLLAKWLPSINATSKKTKRLALILVNGLNLTEEKYRKTLSKLRAHLGVVECKISANEWDKIDYEQVPSKANILYSTAFLMHDKERREEFLNRLTKGQAKINADVLFPHDVVHKYCQAKSYYNYHLISCDQTLEALWQSLPNFVGDESNTICVMDGSGSMLSLVPQSSTTLLEVACSLSIYFAEKSVGQFKNNFITFSKNPQLIDLSNLNTLHAKIGKVLSYTEVANTNIEAVFDLILQTAINNKMKLKDLPKNVLILSDMEFDYCTETNVPYAKVDDKLFEVISKKYKANGYKLPRLIFWNLGGSTRTIPIKENDFGVALVSGFSATICKMIFTDKTNPYEILLDQLSVPRYDAVENAIKGLN